MKDEEVAAQVSPSDEAETLSIDDFEQIEERKSDEDNQRDNDESDDDYDLQMPTYDREDFLEINRHYISGSKRINITATSLVFGVVVKVLKDIIEQLNTILSKDKLITFPHVRKFILSQLCLQQLELCVYGAFRSPEDDLFYQDPDSPDWELMRQNLEISNIENQDKYKKELRKTLNNVLVGGAAVYKAMEEKNSFMQGISLMSNSVHYQLQPEGASEQFRYWIGTNQHQHETMLIFFNLMNDNKFVKEGAKMILDRI